MNTYQFIVENSIDVAWEPKLLTLRAPRKTSMGNIVKDLVVNLQLKDYNNSRAEALSAGIELMKIKLEEMKDE